MRLVSLHYWITYPNTDDIRHIREIGDTNHTYCNASKNDRWFSDNKNLDVALEQVCPVCYALYSLELF